MRLRLTASSLVLRGVRTTYSLIARSPAAPLLGTPVFRWTRRRITATRVTAQDVIEVLRELSLDGVDAWLVGGWACDALLGRQTREHGDLDLVIAQAHERPALAALERLGFSVRRRFRSRLLNVAVVLADRRWRRVTLHLVDIGDRDFRGWHRLLRAAGRDSGIDLGPLFATGWVGGEAVPCVSAAAQLVLHTGYEPGDSDRRDVRLLCRSFSLPAPAEYRAGTASDEARSTDHASDTYSRSRAAAPAARFGAPTAAGLPILGTWLRRVRRRWARPGQMTALLIAVPEAELACQQWGIDRDRVGVPGLPLHVTVLFPFMSPSTIDADVERSLEELTRGLSPFGYALTRLGRFPDVLYLEPSPRAPFVALTESVTARWPKYRPYEGAYATTMPHLTLAIGEEPPGLAAGVVPTIPIRAVARELILMTGSADGAWVERRRFALGGA